MFGFAAQRSDFCLRAATIEFWNFRNGPRFPVWLAVFGSALLAVQLLVRNDMLDEASVRQLSNAGSMSGAVVGGMLFGTGMILARGCASRLLVLSATGNMRALVTGLLLTVVAQASLTGALSPLREEISRWWIVDPATRNLSAQLPTFSGELTGLAIVVLAIVIAFSRKMPTSKLVFGAIVGLSVAAGWAFTSALSAVAFDPVPVESITFTGPSADTLMALINTPDLPLSFGIGLVPGVFAGSALAAATSGTFRIQSFSPETGMARYLAGAILMGFGGMLAGGCAVGAGITGGSVLSLTAWVALLAMWLSAGVTDRLMRYLPSSDRLSASAQTETATI
ncbi:YeeE/YedE family protein [Stappia sp. GBMRC 2046]|uniref:YeeE/YedE family protein n=2 Tax=Stappia sediminis TaxID=2692190 RepID=A0A7X3LV13_9HYPH|nr:YeeE/YedE family protein [Stappia sediminis]